MRILLLRIGNAAYQQLQIDVFGEIADATFQALKAGMEPSERGQALRPVVLEYLATAWRQPDEGVWETRGGAAALRSLEGHGLGRVRSRGERNES